MDVGEGWDLESEDGMSCYGEDSIRAELDDDDVPNEFITVNVERKSSTGSQVSADSLDAAEDFEPVQVDLASIRTALTMYQRHNKKKISMSKIVEEEKAPPK